jgi:hypothetical protein
MGPSARRATSLFALVGLLATVASPLAAGAVEPSRAEYVVRLEAICKPRSEATSRAVRGTRGDIQGEKFKLAASKFAKAERIFAGTVGAISKVPRPAADRKTLSRWFAALGKETGYLRGSAVALRAENPARFQNVNGQFFRYGAKTNNIVVSFGFNYCAFKPSRYE